MLAATDSQTLISKGRCVRKHSLCKVNAYDWYCGISKNSGFKLISSWRGKVLFAALKLDLFETMSAKNNAGVFSM